MKVIHIFNSNGFSPMDFPALKMLSVRSLICSEPIKTSKWTIAVE